MQFDGWFCQEPDHFHLKGKYGIIYNMGKWRFAFILIFLTLVYTAQAQDDKPLIQLNPFSIEGIGPEESGLIISLVQSYLSDIGHIVGYPTVETRSRPGTVTQNAAADYTISGKIKMERDGPLFLLEITDTKTGENYSVSTVYKNSGEMALKARSVLESAFPGGFETTNKSSAPVELSENLVMGMWKGEAGIEMIRLMQGGRGLAIFSSGAQMVVSYSIQGRLLRIWQISPNSERYYHPLPLEAARRLATGAEPMIWELQMYQEGTVLGGIRVSTAARIINGNVTGLLPGGDVREVTWTKIGP